MLTAQQIITFDDAVPPPGASPWVPGQAPAREVDIVAADPTWPATYRRLATAIRDALGDVALHLEHVGSTSVPGLAAKPIIDVDLTVSDSSNEDAYLPALEAIGFVLTVREPWWYGHRCLRQLDPRGNLHVFSPNCPEAERHRILRDWLTAHPEERELYARAKRAAGERTRAIGGDVSDYNAMKQTAIRELYARAFRARGWLE